MASGNFGWPTGGSTFSGATPPSWLGGLAQYASPEEWRTQGSAFVLNPSMLEQRYKFTQLGRQAAEEEANRPMVERQAQIQRQQADLASRMFNPATYADDLRRQQEMERQKMAMENSAMMLRRKQMQQMGGRFGLGTNPEFLRGLGISPTESLQPSWSSNYRVPVFPA